MDIHQTRKAEIDAKEEKFNNVFDMADELIATDHYATIEIKEKIGDLREKKNLLNEDWDIHWDDLQLSKKMIC